MGGIGQRNLAPCAVAGLVWLCSCAQPGMAADTMAADTVADGLSPEQAVRRMEVPEGFQVALAAAEPDLHQPIAMALDHRGRVWIAEAYNYPQRAPEGQGQDKIVILEDTTGDGRLDSRKVFAEGLNLVSGLELGFGGVWVGAAPYLLFLPDQDHDDRPDGPPRVLLDGFGFEDTHETLNSFCWGPDGWLYGCHGVFTHSRVGPPGTPAAERIPLNAGVWRYHPTRHVFEVFAWGTSNPWGVDFDDRGEAFITACVIPHLYHVIQGARYQRQAGSHFQPYIFDDIKTIADHLHYAGSVGDHAWWGREHTPLPRDTSEAGGGHAHCGCLIYLGDNWPPEYRNALLVCNVHGNRVNRERLTPRGSGFVGQHAPDFLLAHDGWFRGIGFRLAPNGTVYLIDWYDRNACHRNNPEIWDRTNGRLYNISFGRPDHPPVDLSRCTDLQLAELQQHPNEWHVRTARRLLQERGATGPAAAELRRQLASSATVERQLRALWSLHVTGSLTDEERLRLIDHAHPALRGWAIRLLLEDRQLASEQLRRLEQLAQQESSPAVLLTLASAAQRVPPAERWPLVDALVRRDGDASDHNLPLMIWYAMAPLVDEDVSRALAWLDAARVPRATDYLIRYAAQRDAHHGPIIGQLRETTDPGQRLAGLQALRQALQGRRGLKPPAGWAAAYAAWSRESGPLADVATDLALLWGDRQALQPLQDRLLAEDQPAERRRQALQALVAFAAPESVESILHVLDVPQLQSEALRGLATWSDDRIPPAILQRFSAWPPELRRAALQTLTSRAEFARELLQAVATGNLPRDVLTAFEIRQLQALGDPSLIDQLESFWGSVRGPRADLAEHRQRLVQLMADAAAQPLDLVEGRRTFDKECGSCHRLFGEGGNLGPDLTGSNRTHLEYVLDNVLDPSSLVATEYRATLLHVNGRVMTGLVQSETEETVGLHTLLEEIMVPKSEIEERQLSDKSFMPDGLLDPLSEQQIRNLLAYLASPVQVPAQTWPALPEDASAKQAVAMEGEGLRVVQASTGRVVSQPMASFPRGTWSGQSQLWWLEAAPGARLELQFDLPAAGTYRIWTVMTKARDYGTVQFHVNGQPAGAPVELFHGGEVVTTGWMPLGEFSLGKGTQTLTIELLGRHPYAQPAFMFGLDQLCLIPVDNPAAAPVIPAADG